MRYEDFDSSMLQSADGENFADFEGFDSRGGMLNLNPTSFKQRGKFQSKGIKEDNTITVTVTNNSTSRQKFELFNALNSIAYAPNNSQYGGGALPAIQPLSSGKLAQFLKAQRESLRGGAVVPLTLIDPNNIISNIALFDDGTGDLVYIRNSDGIEISTTDLPSTSYIDVFDPTNTTVVGRANVREVNQVNSLINATTAVVVSCQEVPYQRLLKSLTSMVFVIRRTRMTTTNPVNYSNSISFEEFSDFGSSNVNSLSPQSYKSPIQFQTEVVDIPMKTIVDKNTAWYMNIEAGSSIQFIFNIEGYSDSGATWNL